MTASRNPVSLEQIELQIIGYYAHQFHVGVHTISSTTDLKRHFNFTFSDWAAEAKHLSELDWIKRLGVSLAESEMNSNPTTAELARLIQSKLDDNAAMVGQVRSIGVRETPNQGDYVVWYGTNRRPVDLNDSTKGYSAERDSKMHYGICKVYIPRSHQIGSLGAPWWKRTLTGQDDRLKLFAVKEMVDSAYWQAIASHMSDLSAPERQALIFVHGYNSSFQHAALRAAQIGFDLGIKGAMAFFSWPSLAATGSYAADEATIDASELMITDFLVDFAARSTATSVHIIAHSMGNRGVLRAMDRVAMRAERASGTSFGQIILAAADVDSDTFRNLCSAYARVARRTTLYVSARDLASEASRWLHEFPRVGLVPPVLVAAGIDTINVTSTDMTMLGHGYVAEARDVLRDIYELIVRETPPERRPGLRADRTEKGELFWVMGSPAR